MRHFTGGGMLHIEAPFPHIPSGMTGMCGGFYADNEVGLRDSTFPYVNPCSGCLGWWDAITELVNREQVAER